jgi:hypothetical protein
MRSLFLVLLFLLAPLASAKNYIITLECKDSESGFSCTGMATDPLSSSSSSSSSSASTSSSSSASTSSTSSSSNSSSSSGIAYAYTVGTAAELKTALGKVAAGETILLRDGNYGDLVIGKAWPDYIDLVAQNKHKAVFGAVSAAGAVRGYVRFDGIRATSYDLRTGAHHFELLNSLVTSNLYFKDVSDIVVRNTAVRSDITDALHSVRANNIKRAVFEHNLFTGAQEDLMAVTGSSEDVRIVKNSFYNTKPKQTYGPIPVLVDGVQRKCEYNHSDALQFFGSNGVSPSKVLIEGNLFFDDPSDNERRLGCAENDVTITPQGIFLSDPNSIGYDQITIRANVFYLCSANTIYINGAKNVLVENNTLIGCGNGGGGIRVVEKAGKSNAGLVLRNNLARSISVEGTTYKLPDGANTIYQGLDAPKLFSFDGMAATWGSFLPRSTDFPETVGATTELRKIQAGTSLAPGAAH